MSIISGEPGLEDLRNVSVIPNNCSSFEASWLSPIPTLTYTYAVAVFDGQSIRAINIGSDTDTVFGGLENQVTYIVVVIAISGDLYSGNYRLFELGML